MNLPTLFEFLQELQSNNSKDFFDANRKRYEALREEWFQTIEKVLGKMQEFDPAIKDVLPKDCMFRINRDIRFSKDKSPYKTNFSIVINPDGKKSPKPSYYFHLEHNKTMFSAGGVWMPEKAVLDQVREYIASEPEKVKEVLEDKQFMKVYGGFDRNETLKTLPKGYFDDVPYPELIKLKSFTCSKTIDKMPKSSEQFVDEVVSSFKSLTPLIFWLRNAIS
jgi:uncharacterized protein (TIGR02453 family)